MSPALEALPPAPAEVVHLRASNTAGAAFGALAIGLTLVGLVFSATHGVWWWGLGQVVLSLAFVHLFVILHECGHATLFRTRVFNVVIGHVAGFWSLIPYPLWLAVHGQHHKWTGWQDLDPTTETLTSPPGAVSRHVVNMCWKYWIPLFSVVYRVQNYWFVPRLQRVMPRRDSARFVPHVLALAMVYLLVIWAVGPWTLLRLVGVALLLALMVQDVLILSQHTHIPMDRSAGHDVAPHRPLDQERFTRSLRLPSVVSRLMLHVDAHELHHMYPFIPGYRLREVPYSPVNEVGWWGWVRAARAIPGEVFLFRNRRETGFHV